MILYHGLQENWPARIRGTAAKPSRRARCCFDTVADTAHYHELTYVSPPLEATTAPLAEGHVAVIPSLNDKLDAAMLKLLANYGIG